MFTVEIRDSDKAQDEGSEVQIHLDRDSLDVLINSLESLRNSDDPDHLHFMSESWGMGDLTEQKQGGSENSLVHHLKVIRWP